jgi:hypothetical protein
MRYIPKKSGVLTKAAIATFMILVFLALIVPDGIFARF